jgi:AcrR family transcriptional regulator
MLPMRGSRLYPPHPNPPPQRGEGVTRHASAIPSPPIGENLYSPLPLDGGGRGGGVSRRYRGVSLEKRQESRRAKLVEAGLSVIGSQGYNAATVRAICAEAGLTERYFYESFENREALLTAVYEHCIQNLTDIILTAIRAVPSPAPDTLSRAGLTAFFEALQRDPRIGRVLFIEILGVSETVDDLYRRTTLNFTQLVLQVSRPLYPGGRIPVQDEELVATGLVGAMIMIATRWILGGYDKPLAVVVQSSIDIFTAVNAQLIAQAQRSATESSV